MYDIFVECPEEKVGLLCSSIASGILSDLIEGRAADGSYRCLVEAARMARDRAGQPLGAWAREIESAWGSDALSDACDYLKLQGYLTEREASVNFSGAEIEEAIISALYDAFSRQETLNTGHILAALNETFPLSRTMDQNISRLREWASGRARNASAPTNLLKHVVQE